MKKVIAGVPLLAVVLSIGVLIYEIIGLSKLGIFEVEDFLW